MKRYIANVRIHKIDRNGNTYHDVTILDMDGNEKATLTKQYGYGTAYKETAAMLCNGIEGMGGQYTYINASLFIIFIVNTF